MAVKRPSSIHEPACTAASPSKGSPQGGGGPRQAAAMLTVAIVLTVSTAPATACMLSEGRE